uniref:Uncharacterized protein n=2 Tax=Salvator merianae TaxID=96440 RepID=A0A8D0BX10_SALMN
MFNILLVGGEKLDMTSRIYFFTALQPVTLRLFAFWLRRTTMATGNLVKKCCDEATCSLCLEYFRDPVMVDCGHNFCQVCIAQCLEEAVGKSSCPQCRETILQRNFRPNRQLTNFVELIKTFQQEQQEEEKWGVCGKHQEPLKLFCKEDRMCVCVVCGQSKEHKDHKVLPLEEASELYKGVIKNQILPCLVKKRQELEALWSNEEQKSPKTLAHLKKEKEKILSAFEQLQKALEESKSSCMSWLDNLEKKMNENKEENAAEFLDQIANLNSLIVEMEEKCQQPASEFLQDIADRIDTCVRAKNRRPVMKPTWELEPTLRMWTQRREAFETLVKDCKGSLVKSLHKVNVTLDQDTVHPNLFASANWTTVTVGNGSQWPATDPGRFDTMQCVLGCEKFTAGRHHWHVEIEGNRAKWVVGVARESVKRKGAIKFGPEEGVWAIQSSDFPGYYNSSIFQVSALMSPSQSFISSCQLSKVRVFLDYEAGRVAFSDGCTGKLVFAFSSASFAEERVCPFFQVFRGTTLNCC